MWVTYIFFCLRCHRTYALLLLLASFYLLCQISIPYYNSSFFLTLYQILNVRSHLLRKCRKERSRQKMWAHPLCLNQDLPLICITCWLQRYWPKETPLKVQWSRLNQFWRQISSNLVYSEISLLYRVMDFDKYFYMWGLLPLSVWDH